jgi:hypothetical protein
MFECHDLIEITPAGAQAVSEMAHGYAPTAKGRTYALPLIQAAAVFEEMQRRRRHEPPADFAEQIAPHCLTCGDTGRVPVGEAGNQEFDTNCPDCGPLSF